MEVYGLPALSSGFPVTISSDFRYLLQGSSPNGVTTTYRTLPDALSPGNLNLNGNTRTGFVLQYGSVQTAVLETPGSPRGERSTGPGMLNFAIY